MRIEKHTSTRCLTELVVYLIYFFCGYADRDLFAGDSFSLMFTTLDSMPKISVVCFSLNLFVCLAVRFFFLLRSGRIAVLVSKEGLSLVNRSHLFLYFIYLFVGFHSMCLNLICLPRNKSDRLYIIVTGQAHKQNQLELHRVCLHHFVCHDIGRAPRFFFFLSPVVFLLIQFGSLFAIYFFFFSSSSTNYMHYISGAGLNASHCFLSYFFLFNWSISRFSLEIFSYCKLAHRLRQSFWFFLHKNVYAFRSRISTDEEITARVRRERESHNYIVRAIIVAVVSIVFVYGDSLER